MTLSKRLVFLIIGLAAALSVYVIFRYETASVFTAGTEKRKSIVEPIDLRLKDARLLFRGEATPDKNVVVVAIDAKSVKEIGRWPWPRTVIADLITNLKGYGVKVTSLDIVFSEADNSCKGSENDRLLGKRMFGAGNVVAGYFFRTEPQPVDERSFAHIEARQLKPTVDDNVTNIPVDAFTGIDLNVAEVGGGALDHGFFTVSSDGDGIYRRSTLVALFGDGLYGSLALKSLAAYSNEDITLHLTRAGVSDLKIGSTVLPVDAGGKLRLNYYGKTGSFTTVSAVDVIKKRLPVDRLKNKLVFVGATETGIFDLRPSPFDPYLPGVEIHATVASNVLQRVLLKYDVTSTRRMESASILLLPVLLGVLLAYASGTLVGLLAACCVTAGFLSFNYIMFARYLHDMCLAYPLLGVVLTYVGGEVYRNLVVERKGKQLKKAFSSYVSPDLVKQIEKDPDKLVLGGEQRELTILFSDIRGFTTVSETLAPPDLVKLLNEYLSPMTRIVLEERGTLDKFIGDAVMALFNAPLDVPDHAERACRAAVRMMEELGRLNILFAERGMNVIDIGIGINTGPAVVGNMGADIRFDYTAIGDSVNLASRLEGLNKQYSSHILVSDETRRQVAASDIVFREVDRVRVKGKLHPVVMYELMVSNKEIVPFFEDALDVYRSRDFDRAADMFERIAADTGDGPSRLYMERSREYIETPPPANWDGVYVAKAK